MTVAISARVRLSGVSCSVDGPLVVGRIRARVGRDHLLLRHQRPELQDQRAQELGVEVQLFFHGRHLATSAPDDNRIWTSEPLRRRADLRYDAPAFSRDTLVSSIPQEVPMDDNAIVVEAWNTVLFDKFVRFKHLLIAGPVRPQRRRCSARRPFPPGARVLDVGCGFGDSTIRIARRSAPDGEAVGVDCAENFIAAAREEAQAAGAGERALLRRRRADRRPRAAPTTTPSRASARCSSTCRAPRCATSARSLKPGGELTRSSGASARRTRGSTRPSCGCARSSRSSRTRTPTWCTAAPARSRWPAPTW